MTNTLIIVGFATILLTVLLVLEILHIGIRGNPWRMLRRALIKPPKTRHLGPIVDGENQSKKVKFNGDSFAFPHPSKKNGEVHALVDPTISLKGKTKLVLRYRIDADPGVTFHPQESPASLAIISLMIQRKGDDYSGSGPFNFHRIYAPQIHALVAGEGEIIEDITSSTGWGGVEDEGLTMVHMQGAIDNLHAVHVCFGGGNSRAHGVYSSGPAKFTLLELTAV